jgi:hypothetical protein
MRAVRYEEFSLEFQQRVGAGRVPLNGTIEVT